jgi:hypothetical protein
MEFQRYLHDARIARAGESSKQWVGKGCHRIEEVRPVQGIEHLPSQLELLPLGDGESFEQAGVEIFNAGAKQEIAAGRAEPPKRGQRENRGIEELLNLG